MKLICTLVTFETLFSRICIWRKSFILEIILKLFLVSI